jgi:CRISPR-associated protein Csd2
MAVETKKEADSQGGDNRTMGRKAYVPYGLYRAHGFVSAPLARQTGFTEDDLELLWNALIYMFDHDRSASRGEMATQKLFIFKHNSELGNAPAHKLFDLIKVERKNLSLPARKFSDYQVDIEKEGLPDGVELFDRI